ncbi:LacI family transcriptional regulator [Treponema sp. TIM-1]|uniref:LacI family DNA-binding transcriptional regulator n=1 Tax=Treponema sp. TIM-1 TaxID=2898417 RepID=UPI003980E34D
MITIKQIAVLAKVSPTTVSNVIHGRTDEMTPETLQRVQRVIKENDYVSNMSGRSLAKYGSKIIAVVKIEKNRKGDSMTHDPFFAEIIGTIEREVRTRGYFMMLYVSADVDECLHMVKAWNVEGMIICGCGADGCTQFVRSSEVPVVFIDGYFHNDGLPYANIGADDFHGGYVMTEYLIQQGHKRIAFLADFQKLQGEYAARRAGYKKALKKHGIPFLPEDYIYINNDYQKRHKDYRNSTGGKLYGYTALFFASDFLAADYVNLLSDDGIHIPGDISVCGFDDNLYAVQTRPRLTTIHQDVPLKAFHAVEQILRMIRREPVAEYRIILPVSLVIRDSVKKLN